YEPVLRFTEGELFLPMSVETYVQGAALWSDPGPDEDATLVIDHGKLDLDGLCAQAESAPPARLHLRYASEPLSRRQLREWRRDPGRPRLRSSTRFAAVGLFGRII